MDGSDVNRNSAGRARTAAFAGLGLAAALTLSACASSASNNSGASSGPSSGTGTSVGSAVTAADLSIAQKYVGGTAGAAKSSLAPIKIGLVANVEGPTAQPYLADTADDVAKLVNSNLGGVAGGHPLQFVRCSFGGTAEEGQLCGQKFANDPSIKFVLFPGGTTGGPQLHAANNGAKAYLCTIGSPADANVANQFCTSGGPLASGAMITYMKQYVKAKSISLITIDDPSLVAIGKQVAGLFNAADIKVTTGLAPAGASDVTQTVLASKAQSTDGTLLLLPNDTTCIPIVKAFKSLNITKPVVALPGCADDSVKKATGDYPKFAFYEYGTDPHVADPQMSVYLHVMAANGTTVGSNAPQVFGSALLVAKLINELGANNLTTASVSKKLAAFTGPAFLGDDTLSFGNKPFTSIGSLRARFFSYTGNGKWVDATKGKWLVAPAP